ncbi:Cysteine protease ATG4A, partial [Diplonema papillatum]
MGEEGANYRPTVEHSEQAGEPDGWNVGVDMIRSAVYHSYYSLKTSWQDITEGNALFPKGVDGEIYLTGGKCFQDESDPEFEEELKNYCWFSYRKGFSGLPDLSYDTGWGCVHRAGQMTIMTALNRHLGCPYYNLLPHFRDLDHACFSIQNIANTGRKYGKEPGQWFAVSTIAHVLK